MCSGFEALEDKGFRYLEAECCFVGFCKDLYAVYASCKSSHLLGFRNLRLWLCCFMDLWSSEGWKEATEG